MLIKLKGVRIKVVL